MACSLALLKWARLLAFFRDLASCQSWQALGKLRATCPWTGPTRPKGIWDLMPLSHETYAEGFAQVVGQSPRSPMCAY